jgi:hypothetical protein
MKEKTTRYYINLIAGNIVGLLFVNTVLLWRPYTHGVILASWSDILWAANISQAVQIIGNFLLCFYRPRWFSAMVRAAFSAAGLLSILVFWVIFPLDFSHLVGTWLNTLLKVVLMIGMVGALAGFLVELVRFLRYTSRVASEA